jgi:diadenylate cyclase
MRQIIDTIWRYLQRVANYDPWVVLVELLLIGFMIWWIVRFLKGTRGAGLVKGVAMLLAAVYLIIRLLPEELGWDRLEYLFGRFLLFAFVAGVVAFQPELRRALMQIGQARILRSGRGDAETTVDALVESVAYLSRNKIGAVIAVERSVGLGALSESGMPVDAVLTASLLNTIFYPGSAMHDMGVVIRDGRIVAAGCQFPLAESEEVDPALGSRHRAALGLAKDSDAIVLVVSEETGRVSIAYQGHLDLGLTGEGIREMLMAALTSPGVQRRRRKLAAEVIAKEAEVAQKSKKTE